MRDDALALCALGAQLRALDYSFVTVTPETHRRVNARAERLGALQAKTWRDVFGWNRPFDRSLVPEQTLAWLRAADALEETATGFRSRVRFSTLHGQLFVHSAFPTTQADAVFFGPDTYRFCALLARWAPPAKRAVDIGCGSGAGGVTLAARVQSLILADLSPRALAYAEVNAALANCAAAFVQSDVLAAVAGELDLIVANPPYMRDAAARVYRDGGADYGTELSVRIVEESLQRLSPGGTLILYTGAPIVDGVDVLARALRGRLAGVGQVTYEELDPDVFGEELEQPAYAEVERIAVVGLRVRLSGL